MCQQGFEPEYKRFSPFGRLSAQWNEHDANWLPTLDTFHGEKPREPGVAAIDLLRKIVEEGGRLRGKIWSTEGGVWLHQGSRCEQFVEGTAAQELLDAGLIEFEKEMGPGMLYNADDKLYVASTRGRNFIASFPKQRGRGQLV